MPSWQFRRTFTPSRHETLEQGYCEANNYRINTRSVLTEYPRPSELRIHPCQGGRSCLKLSMKWSLPTRSTLLVLVPRRIWALPPARGFAILTCMDARLDPAKYAGLSEGDAHVIRNAGGRASDDAIRSLVISHKLLGTREWFVIHHTNCGMELFTDDVIGDLLDDCMSSEHFGHLVWR